MINIPDEFKTLNVVSYILVKGKFKEITTAHEGEYRHWKSNGESWHLSYIQQPDGTIIYP